MDLGTEITLTNFRKKTTNSILRLDNGGVPPEVLQDIRFF